MTAATVRLAAAATMAASLIASHADVRAQHALAAVLDRRPNAVIDLRTDEGVRLVQGEWRYKDAAIVPVDFRGPGPDLKPTGAPQRTFDVFPRAGAAGFDDTAWPVAGATTLEARRTGGRLSFGWFRLAVTIPPRIGTFDPTGSTAVLEIVVDDYAEVWVDGQLPRTFGQAGGAFPRGYSAPNRVVIGRGVRPGQTIQLAVLGINGPISDPPANYVWIRSATIDFISPPELSDAELQVETADTGLDAILPVDARLEKVAEGFEFIEGPVWVPEGYLLFSDPNRNTIYRYTPDEGVAVYRTKSGYTGPDIHRYHQPGSNGLALDPGGRLTINEHGNRRVTRLEPNGGVTVLADRYEGKRLNSPNDLVYRSDGTLYFTDPPFGLPDVFADSAKELPWSGVFRLKGGQLSLVARELTGPNGLAFSPDERYLYVDNWDPAKKVVMRYDVQADGSVRNGTVFFDMTAAPGEEALDGLKVDARGNLYVSGPGGLWILSPEGRHLGTLRMPEQPANFAWGDEDGRTLYLTARTGLYRLRLNIPGARPLIQPRPTQ
jgi:gluconolactonase